MAEGVQELARMVVAAATSAAAAYEHGDLDTAREGARVVLSAGSKLHARLGILVELRNDGIWSAEVDRALRKAKAPPAELDGQASIDDVLPTPPARGKRPRKGG